MKKKTLLIKAAGRPWQSWQAAQWPRIGPPSRHAGRALHRRRQRRRDRAPPGRRAAQGIEHHRHRREQAGRWRLGGHRRGGPAQPDGTTLLLASTSPLTIYPHLAKTNYDPLKDLTPLASVAVAPVAIVATKALPVKDFAGLIEFAKSRPDGVRYGTPGQGTVAHIGMSALTAQTGTKMLHVPYRGNSQALTDGLGGVVELLVINSDVVLPHVASGALKPLAVMAPQRLAAWPDVPTMAELKLPQLQYYSNFGVFGPAKLSPAVVQSVQAALAKATASADFRTCWPSPICSRAPPPAMPSSSRCRTSTRATPASSRRWHQGRVTTGVSPGAPR